MTLSTGGLSCLAIALLLLMALYWEVKDRKYWRDRAETYERLYHLKLLELENLRRMVEDQQSAQRKIESENSAVTRFIKPEEWVNGRKNDSGEK